MATVRAQEDIHHAKEEECIDDPVIFISSDHGKNMDELCICGEHTTGPALKQS